MTKKKTQTTKTEQKKKVKKAADKQEVTTQPIVENKSGAKKTHHVAIALGIVLAIVVASISIYINDLFGARTYITSKYNEYIYNLPENVAYRAQQARLLAQKQAEYTTQLAKINQWVREYDQATASAGMSEASAEARTVHITQLIADAIAHDDPVFGRIDGLLADFSTTVKNVAIANSKNYYSKLLDESSSKLAKYDAKLMNKKVQQELEQIEKEMRNAINEASFDGMLAQIQDFDRQVVKAKPTAKPTPASQSNSQEALASTPINNTPPGSGYSSQVVEVDGQRFTVKIVAADMGSTKVVVDTATDGECRENCPVLSLGQYVARSGAFAGINGSFFMPYDNTNSFDGYVKNKNGTCINPNSDGWRAIFNVGSMSFTAGSEWGCQGDEGGIGNYPLLVYGGAARGEHSDPKISATKSARSFVGNKGSTAYIGVVHNSTSLEAGKVLQTMGLDNALGLDAGGSTALWAAGGYKVGPNRGLPNAILFVAR